MSEYQGSKSIDNEAERLRRIGAWANQVTQAALSALIENGPTVSTVLVAGCGTGSEFEPIAAVLPGAEIVGVDQSEEALEKAAATGLAARLIRADVRTLSSDPDIAEHDPFDLFFVRQALFHIPDPGGVIEEAKKIVKPGGTVLAQEPNWDVAKGNWIEFVAFKGAMMKAMRAVGINPTLGKDLRELFSDAGLSGLVEIDYKTKVGSGDERWETLDFLVDVASGIMGPFLEEYGISSPDELKARIEKAKTVPSNFFIPPSWVVVSGTTAQEAA